MMMSLIFLKKLFFRIFYLLVLMISFENVKLKYGDIQMYTLKPNVHILVQRKKLLASSWAMFKFSHKIMYVRRIVHKQFKIAYPLLLAIWKPVKILQLQVRGVKKTIRQICDYVTFTSRSTTLDKKRYRNPRIAWRDLSEKWNLSHLILNIRTWSIMAVLYYPIFSTAVTLQMCCKKNNNWKRNLKCYWECAVLKYGEFWLREVLTQVDEKETSSNLTSFVMFW